MSENPTPTKPVAPAREKGWLGRLSKRILIIAAVVACLAIALAGFSTAFGWWLATNTVVANASTGKVETVKVPAFSANAGNLMPDVRGLTPDQALETIADAGIPVATVTQETRPAAGKSGLVLEQTPVFGTASPGAVHLVVSSPAAVPNLAGLSKADAVSRLIELGSRVSFIDVYKPGADVGVVTAVSPSAGSALPAAVTLTVTAAPSSAYLSGLDYNGDCRSTDSLVLKGSKFPESLTCQSGGSTPEQVSWQFAGAVDDVRGTIGIPDAANPGDTATVTISGDGRVLASFPVSYGNPHAIALSTTGVLRLTISIAGGSTRPDVGLGSLVARGASGPIANLPRN